MSDISSLTICCITGAGKLTDAATSSGMFCEDNDLSSSSLLVVEFDTVSDTDEGLSTAGGVTSRFLSSDSFDAVE